MRKLLALAAVLLVGLALLLSVNAASADDGGDRLSTTLLGANEIPGLAVPMVRVQQ